MYVSYFILLPHCGTLVSELVFPVIIRVSVWDFYCEGLPTDVVRFRERCLTSVKNHILHVFSMIKVKPKILQSCFTLCILWHVNLDKIRHSSEKVEATLYAVL